MNIVAVVDDSVSVEHSWRIEIAFAFVDYHSVGVEVVDNAAVGACGPSVVAQCEPVGGTVAVGACQVVGSQRLVVERQGGCAHYYASESEIEFLCQVFWCVGCCAAARCHDDFASRHPD